MPRNGVPSAPTGRVAQLDRVSASGADAHPAAARFWSKVDKNGPVVRPELGPCWQWTAGVTSAGYGSFGVVTNPRWMVSAHKVSWTWSNGPVADGMVLLHACDNRRCVRPEHMSVGTVADNNADMAAKGRSVKGRKWNGDREALAETQRRRIRALADRVAAGQLSYAKAVHLVLETP